ncbi:hypothetical protein [Winogradskyella sp. PE311]|uniref:hypothetical protein n=1 Tax=Winogradskyella sp. PE311 TaxID=3366943 RepID=UPI00397FD042
MNLTRHCVLCENQITSLSIGSTCKLTNKAPDFYKKCVSLNLGDKFTNEIHKSNLELHLILKKKNTSYLKVLIIAIIGIFFIVGNGFLTDGFRPLRYYSVYRTSVIGVGVLVLINANFSLQNFLNELKSAKSKKRRIDEVLDTYGIRYKSIYNYKDEIHGNKEIEIIIEYKNWKKKRTTSTFVINS